MTVAVKVESCPTGSLKPKVDKFTEMCNSMFGDKIDITSEVSCRGTCVMSVGDDVVFEKVGKGKGKDKGKGKHKTKDDEGEEGDEGKGKGMDKGKGKEKGKDKDKGKGKNKDKQKGGDDDWDKGECKGKGKDNEGKEKGKGKGKEKGKGKDKDKDKHNGGDEEDLEIVPDGKGKGKDKGKDGGKGKTKGKGKDRGSENAETFFGRPTPEELLEVLKKIGENVGVPVPDEPDGIADLRRLHEEQLAKWPTPTPEP